MGMATETWVRVHVDYAGPFLGQKFLILVDAHCKWIEVKTVTNAMSAITIECIRSIFATHGLTEMLVSNNGSVFIRTEFSEFVKHNGIRHVKSAPYHAASNGLAERAVAERAVQWAVQWQRGQMAWQRGQCRHSKLS